MKVVILTFSYNDWRSAGTLFGMLDDELQRAGLQVEALLVDDASTEPSPVDWRKPAFVAITSLQVLRLAQNLGHQRALAVGLCYASEHLLYDAIVVLDADGEDLPEDAIRLVRSAEKSGNNSAIFAERSRRSEGLVFRIFYQLYRLLHLLLTGKGIRVGNFSILPRELVASLVVDPNLWNHYAAAVFNSRLPRTTIPVRRGQRLFGRSRLNFTALVVHGLSAIACYGELIGVRVLLLAFVLSGGVIAGLVAIVAIRLGSDMAIPGWATTAVGFLLVLLLQVVSLAALFTLSILSNRKSSPIIPIRDYHYWVRSVT